MIQKDKKDQQIMWFTENKKLTNPKLRIKW
jgi:hypothetical protein